MTPGFLPFDPDSMGLLGDLVLGAGGGALLFAIFIARAFARGPETGLDPCAGCDGSACDTAAECPSSGRGHAPHLTSTTSEVTP